MHFDFSDDEDGANPMVTKFQDDVDSDDDLAYKQPPTSRNQNLDISSDDEMGIMKNPAANLSSDDDLKHNPAVTVATADISDSDEEAFRKEGKRTGSKVTKTKVKAEFLGKEKQMTKEKDKIANHEKNSTVEITDSEEELSKGRESAQAVDTKKKNKLKQDSKLSVSAFTPAELKVKKKNHKAAVDSDSENDEKDAEKEATISSAKTNYSSSTSAKKTEFHIDIPQADLGNWLDQLEEKVSDVHYRVKSWLTWEG